MVTIQPFLNRREILWILTVIEGRGAQNNGKGAHFCAFVLVQLSHGTAFKQHLISPVIECPAFRSRMMYSGDLNTRPFEYQTSSVFRSRMIYFKHFFQVNLEYLARVAFTDSDVIYPDSVVGTGNGMLRHSLGGGVILFFAALYCSCLEFNAYLSSCLEKIKT